MNDAVIFDVDGVLVDSYEAHLHSWQTLAARTGVQFTEKQFAASFGRTSRDIIEQHWSLLNLSPIRISELDEQKESLYRDIVRQRFPVMDGAIELISALHAAGVALALGSSGPAENVELAIDRMHIQDSISAIVTGQDVSRGKPHPDVFLLAAKRLHVEPIRCAVIEDAPAGIEAAQAAGMASVALLSKGRSRGDFEHLAPGRIVQSLRELSPQSLRALISAQSQN